MAKKGNSTALGDFAGTGIPEAEGGGKAGILSPGFIDNLLKNSDMPSIAKELVHPGKEPIELMMRSVFDDMREVNAAILYAAKCEEFDDTEGLKILLMRMAAKTSIKGRSRSDLLQAITGQLLKSLQENQAKRKGEDGNL